MTALAARVRRLESSRADGRCEHCADWPSEFIMEIREVLATTREEAGRLVDSMPSRDEWTDGCPDCGFRPLCIAIEHVNEEEVPT
jgi:hypothetical protein